MVKKFVIVLALCFPAAVQAENTSLFNWGDAIHQLRVGYSINQHGEKGEVYYTSIITVHNGGETPYCRNRYAI